MITVFFLAIIALVAVGAIFLVMKSGTKSGRPGQSGQAVVTQQQKAEKNHPVD